MAEKSQVSLADFMKKQATAKTAKQKAAAKSPVALNNAKAKKSPDEAVEGEEDQMTDEEKLEEAKKESRGKSENYDKADMFKKLIMESIVKYVLVISIFVIFAIGVIEFLPAFLDMLHGLFFKVLFN